MKKLFRRLVCLVLVVVIIVGIAVFPVIRDGYNLYIDTIEQTPIEVRVEQIVSRDSYTPFDKISPVFINQLIQEEDRRFYSHGGFDVISFVRAMAANISSGRLSQGGSTITQQLAKNMYFSFEKQMERKVAELLVAFRLEKMYSKEEILAMYCALAYFGQNCYGIKRASGYYYSAEPIDLDENQSYQLVETLKAPSVYNPSTMRR